MSQELHRLTFIFDISDDTLAFFQAAAANAEMSLDEFLQSASMLGAALMCLDDLGSLPPNLRFLLAPLSVVDVAKDWMQAKECHI